MHDSALIPKIDAGIRVFLYLLIFWLPYSKAVIESSVVLALILWMIKRTLLTRRFFNENQGAQINQMELLRIWAPAKSFLNGPIAVFLILGVVSTFKSVLFLQSLQGYFMKILEWFIIYFLIIEVFHKKKHIWIAFGIFLFTSAATVLDGLVQFYFTHKDIFSGHVITTDNRATAGFGHPNDLAGYLTFAVLIAMVLLFLEKRPSWKFFMGMILTIISAWALAVTFSRGAWLAAAAGIFLFLYSVCFVRRSMRSFIFIVLMIFILWTGISFTAGKKEFRLDAPDVQLALAWRSNLWQDSFKMILIRPNFGYGPNTFMSTFVDFGRAIRGKDYYKPMYAHNCFIQLAAEMGFWGLGSFLWILVTFFQKGLSQLKSFKAGDQSLHILSIGILGGTLAFLGHSFVDTNLFSLQLSALFWFMIGMQAAIYNQQISFEQTTGVTR